MVTLMIKSMQEMRSNYLTPHRLLVIVSYNIIHSFHKDSYLDTVILYLITPNHPVLEMYRP